MKKQNLFLSLGMIAAVQGAGAQVVWADTAADLSEIFTKGAAGLDFRYRLELVDQDGLAKDATASTLLTRLHYETATYKGFSGFIEAEHIAVVGKTTYNNSLNGKSQYPVVADPAGTELNQAYLQYKSDFATLKLGRQGVNLDDQRFVGMVGWRQNDQTYDSAVAVITPVQDVTAIYGYVWNVNRIFGNDHPLGDLDTDTQLINLSYTGLKGLKVTAYAYLLDLNDAPVLGLSSATYGVRLAGNASLTDAIKLGYQAEYASQRDYKDNPNDYRADFWHLGAEASTGGFSVSLDYELLGSDGGVAFQTPLATLHKFNGWADKFLSTPSGGLRDIYAGIGYKVPGETGLGGLALKAVYHDFRADTGGADYGSEWDFVASKKLSKFLTAEVKAAFYNADSFATDTSKLWL
ncbi:MAG: hypothetical protein EP335_08040, partial [Alphaproteobacteria bacterium]